MPKEKSFNPVAAQRKADKKKEISKSKRNVQDQRNEKLARRNPERVQKQVDELKELETRGLLRPKDRETLAQLERDVRGIRRAREALGDNAPQFPGHERRQRPDDARPEQRQRRQGLGKRRRDSEHAHDGGSDTDPEVRAIPMPRDTPPPIGRERFKDPQVGPDGQRRPHALPSKPAAPAAAAPPQLVYSSAPQLRDLRKEAAKFVPAAVRAKQKLAKGQGRLPEPEDVDDLEKAGYYAAKQASHAAGEGLRHVQAAAAGSAVGGDGVDMDQEVRNLRKELEGIISADDEENVPMRQEKVPARQVLVEDVSDGGD